MLARRRTLQAAQIGAMLALTFVVDDDEDDLPPAVLQVPLVTLTWLVKLLLGLQANITRVRYSRTCRQLNRRWRNVLRQVDQWSIRLQFAQILGHAWLYGFGLAS